MLCYNYSYVWEYKKHYSRLFRSCMCILINNIGYRKSNFYLTEHQSFSSQSSLLLIIKNGWTQKICSRRIFFVIFPFNCFNFYCLNGSKVCFTVCAFNVDRIKTSISLFSHEKDVLQLVHLPTTTCHRRS